MPFRVDVNTQAATLSLPAEKYISFGKKRGGPICLNKLPLWSLLESDVVQIIVQGTVNTFQQGFIPLVEQQFLPNTTFLGG